LADFGGLWLAFGGFWRIVMDFDGLAGGTGILSLGWETPPLSSKGATAKVQI
jgi:hypothetical protein